MSLETAVDEVIKLSEELKEVHAELATMTIERNYWHKAWMELKDAEEAAKELICKHRQEDP
jgi:alkyl hydroperoxide reductase subunit AhpC